MQRQKEASEGSVGFWRHGENKHNYRPEILPEFTQKEREGYISEEKGGTSLKQ